jgi:hypothetical protein
MKKLLAGSALLVVMTLSNIHTIQAQAPAYVGPWCFYRMGRGGSVPDCTMHTFAECYQKIMEDRGFCNQNPSWNGARQNTVRHRKRVAPH